MSEKNLSAYDDLIESVVAEAGVREEEPETKQEPQSVEEAIQNEVDEFVDSVVEEAEMEPVEHTEPEEPEEEEKPEPQKRTLADFPDATYKVTTYNDKSDQKAFYLYSVLGRYPAFPIGLLSVELVLSVWFAFTNNRQDLLRFAGLYFCCFLLADIGFFVLRIHNIIRQIAKKDEHALDTERVEVAFFDTYLVLIKYGFDIRMDYDRLEHYGRMGNRVYLYFDNHKALLMHVDDINPKIFPEMDAMLKKIAAENKLTRRGKKAQ